MANYVTIAVVAIGRWSGEPRMQIESLRDEIKNEDTQSSGCLAAEARVALHTYHLLSDPVRPNRDLLPPGRPSPTVGVLQ